MKQSLTAVVLLLLTVFTACEPETLLTIDQNLLSYTEAGGSQTITLTANKPWSSSSTQSWCRVSPSGGEEATGSRISISCDANTTYDARNATVTITCAELTKQISISQATNSGFLVSQTSYELNKEAQQLNIQIQANVKFSVEVDNGCKDWVKCNSTKGLSTSTLVLDIAENKSYDSREGRVTIKQEGGNLSSSIIIKQNQLDGLFIATPEYNLSNEKHTLTVEVSTNVEFDVKPEADWVKFVQTKGLGTKQIVLEVAENDTYDHRETQVNVKQKNGNLSGTITIKQDEEYGILVSQSEFSLSNEAATIEVEVRHNVDFDVVIQDDCKDWIKQVSTKALSSKTYTFSIAKNESYDIREGSITFKQKEGALCGVVSVRQAQIDALMLSQTDYEISSERQTIDLEIKTNVDYTVQSEATWIHYVNTKGLRTNHIVFEIEANDGKDTREGKVRVEQKDGINTSILSFRQEGRGKVLEKERSVLMALYHSTDGDNWIHNDNWGSDRPVNEWYGVSTSSSGRIEVLNLEDNGLKGTIPDNIGFLTDLLYLDLKYNQLTGKIPSDICKLEKLQWLYLNNNQLSGTIPDEIAQLKDLFGLCLATNNLTGTIPEWIGTLTNLQYLWLNENNLTGPIPATIVSLTKMAVLDFCHNQLSGTIPEQICALTQLEYLNLSDNVFSGPIPESIGNLSSLRQLYLHENNLTGTIPDSIVYLNNLDYLNITKNRLNGILSETLLNSDWWKNRSINLSQQEGYKLRHATLYESTDYSRDGEVVHVLKHTKGKGCKIIITGVAFSDRQIENGRFKEVVDQAIDYFFSREPYTTFKDYFDVYSVAAVSKNEILGEDLAYDATYINQDFSFNHDKVYEYARKVEDISPSELQYTCIMVIVNSRYGIGAYCVGRVGTWSTAEDDQGMEGAIIHEIGGHAFGRLADEYVADGTYYTVTPELKQDISYNHTNKEMLNVDWQNDPKKVIWKDFISNPDYEVEGIGIYEGGLGEYAYGVYRPSKASIMGGTDTSKETEAYYNAPSRWAIYQWIMDLAGEKYTFQDFLEYDKKNLEWFAKNKR